MNHSSGRHHDPAVAMHLLSHPDEDEDDVQAFVSYVESDDDDEDPFFMPEHTKKSSTLSYRRLICSPTQLLRFTVPALCILVIIIYTTVIAVLTQTHKIPNPSP